MNRSLALVRARWLSLASYRMRLAISVGGLVASIVPLYFVAGAVQPIMAGAIRSQGGQAFGFLLVGLTTFTLVSSSVVALQEEVSAGIRTGILEALLATPSSLAELLVGLAGFRIGWSGIQVALMLTAGALLGANLVPERIPSAILILALITAAHFSLGILGAALVLAFRTAGPFPKGVLFVSGLLGGVYYPTHVIPSWLQMGSRVLPLTYGLRALRRVVLEGEPLGAVSGDLAILVLMGCVLLVLGWIALMAALRYARRQGTLAQY